MALLLKIRLSICQESDKQSLESVTENFIFYRGRRKNIKQVQKYNLITIKSIDVMNYLYSICYKYY